MNEMQSDLVFFLYHTTTTNYIPIYMLAANKRHFLDTRQEKKKVKKANPNKTTTTTNAQPHTHLCAFIKIHLSIGTSIQYPKRVLSSLMTKLVLCTTHTPHFETDTQLK